MARASRTLLGQTRGRTLAPMDHHDHVELIRDGVRGSEDGAWADLGSGRGAFTLALAELLEPGGSIVSVDREPGALEAQVDELRRRSPGTAVRYLVADFTAPLDIKDLDGILMANSLHFVADKSPLLARLRQRLRPGGRLLLVEYDTDHGNPWVPYPLSFASWLDIAGRAGLADTRLIARRPSRFLGAIYSAVSTSPGAPSTTTEVARRCGKGLVAMGG